MPGSETPAYFAAAPTQPQRPKFPLSGVDGLGLEMDSLRCLCTENPGDWKGVAEGRGPKLRRDTPGVTGHQQDPVTPSPLGLQVWLRWRKCPAATAPSAGAPSAVWATRPGSNPPHIFWDTTTRLVLPLFLGLSPQSRSVRPPPPGRPPRHSVPDAHSLTVDPQCH